MNYWDLNNKTIKNEYLLSLIDELLNWFGQVKLFTQLDLTNAYHWRRIYEGDKWKMTFRTQYDYFKYQVMSFSLFNTSATFQGYLNKILAKKFNILVIIYLDDILIYTKNLEQTHIQAVHWVLDQFRKHSLFPNLKK